MVPIVNNDDNLKNKNRLKTEALSGLLKNISFFFPKIRVMVFMGLFFKNRLIFKKTFYRRITWENLQITQGLSRVNKSLQPPAR